MSASSASWVRASSAARGARPCRRDPGLLRPRADGAGTSGSVPVRSRSGLVPMAFMDKPSASTVLKAAQVGGRLLLVGWRPDAFGLRRADLQSDAEAPIDAGKAQSRPVPSVGAADRRSVVERRQAALPQSRSAMATLAGGPRGVSRGLRALRLRSMSRRGARRRSLSALVGNVEGAEFRRWRVIAPVVPIHDRLTSPLPGANETCGM